MLVSHVKHGLSAIFGLVIVVGCSSDISQELTSGASGVARSSSTSTVAESAVGQVSPAVAVTTTSSVPAGIVVGPIPTGRIVTAVDDLLVLHDDGDLWLHPRLLSATPEAPIRLVDLADPRVVPSEGPGPNRVDSVVGAMNGVVFFTDCCEPVSGDLYALSGVGAPRVLLAPGDHVALRPDHAALATMNTYAMSVIELPSARAVTEVFAVAPLRLGGEWDVIWSADGRSLIVLDVGSDRFELTRFDATLPFERNPAVAVATRTRPVSGEVRFAGRGPSGEIAVAVTEGDHSMVRFFDRDTLNESPALEMQLPGRATSVRLAPDGVGVLWIDREQLWYRPPQGADRLLGSGFTVAWFTNA